MHKINIAIDGPASSGKSTIAKIIAKDFGFVYTDTGAMYRGVTYLAIKHQVSFLDETALIELIENYPITFKQTDWGQAVLIQGEDVTQALRQPEVTNHVSEVSALPGVRDHLVKVQQKIAASGGVVMDGRDIGTTVLPQAEVKIFLVASASERAKRRYKENQDKGIKSNYNTLKKEIEQRDYTDSHRETSPLKQAKDASLVDTTGFSIDEVVATVESIVKEKMGEVK
ncbi:(d)CMP kinase [Tetragenococcus muriaticus]|uniref:Cytidylate kinase n=1 Tax=Tetragenococcus muriaticus 3MR10-3 TaxID=1302648 RepID=A0A091CCB5_9ENTE|nr:(d)CMP kinase [Tetragenococcus muriaticus]KFN90043.1 cytidylate kinase [Tetragenococcus muriaticus 3MR10-3]GMA47448.1 cytidylate kinase [Tetragenococcus muriaticus]